MKKIGIICMLLLCFCLSGCGKNSEKDIIKDLNKKIDKASAYYLEGILKITNNEDNFTYDVKVSFMAKDNYKVSLKNKANEHEQIILKNSDGVYVLTPSLNKSFKFQSDWPHNNSQIYLLQSIVNDLSSDDKITFEEGEKFNTLISKVNYPNNRQLTKQKVILDKNNNIKEVMILNNDDIPQMHMVFNSIDYKAKFNNNNFKLEEIMSSMQEYVEEKPASSLDDIIYPLYIPSGTKLTSQDKVEKTIGERVILTFDGEKPFLLVEETASKEDEHTIIPTYGEPYLLIDTVGAISDNSITWTSNGIEYYIVSDVMDQLELTEIAKSISSMPTMK